MNHVRDEILIKMFEDMVYMFSSVDETLIKMSKDMANMFSSVY